MPNRFWVGGTGTWDATTTHWSATSGGAAGATVPTAADDVYFDANSGGGTVTVNTATRVCASLSFRGVSGTSDFAGAFSQSGAGTLTISGGLTLSASTNYTGYTGAITFNGTSSYNIVSNGASLSASSITLNGAGLSLSCTDAFTTSGSIVLTQGQLYPALDFSIGSFTLTSNSLTRIMQCPSINFTGAGALVTVGATQTNASFNVTNFYITGSQSSARSLTTSGIVYCANCYLAGTGSGSISFTSTAATGNYVYVFISNTGGASISLGTGLYGNITFQSGTNAVWANAAGQTLTCLGNITLTSTQAAPTLTPAITLTGGSGISQTITSAGKSFVTGTITVNDASGAVSTYQFADPFTTTGGVTITNAGGGVTALAANASVQTFTVTGQFSLTAGSFVCQGTAYIGNLSTSNSNTRLFSIDGDLVLTGAGTLITATTTANLSWGSNSIYVGGSQASARTLSFNTIVYPGNGYCELGGTGSGSITLAVGTTGDPRVYVSNTGGAVVSFSSGNMAELIFSSGTNVTWSNAAAQTLTIDGDLTLVSSMATPTLTPSFIFKGSGTAVSFNSRITMAGKSLVTGTVTLNDSLWTALGGTFTFVDAFSSNAAVTITSAGQVNINANFSITTITTALTLTTGNLSVNNGANINIGVFTSSAANNRGLTMGSGTWTLAGTGTVWNMNASGATLNAQQSRILINNTASPTTTVTFTGGTGLTYYTLEYARGAATANFTISNSNTFANFIDNTSTAAHTLSFASGTTATFYKFNVRGSFGALVTLAKTSTAAAAFVKVGQGIICNSDYLSVGNANITVSPSATWYAGANSGGAGGGNWILTNAPSSQSQLGAGGVG